MRIAFFSDIHANFTALCAAITSAKKHKAAQIYFAGDAIGNGPHPVEVIRLLKEEKIVAIAGNIDRKIIEYIKKGKKTKKLLKDKKKSNLGWTIKQLGEDEVAWLMSLPPEIETEIEGVKFLITHGSPLSDEDYIYPSITTNGINTKLQGRKPNVLVCGHSHIPFVKVVGDNIRIINCGSVGKPIDGDPRGSFVVIEFDKDKFHAEIARFSYKTENIAKDIEAGKVPGLKPDEWIHGIKIK